MDTIRHTVGHAVGAVRLLDGGHIEAGHRKAAGKALDTRTQVSQLGIVLQAPASQHPLLSTNNASDATCLMQCD